MKACDPLILTQFHDAKLGRQLLGRGNSCNRRVRAFFVVEFDHLPDVHSIDMVRAEHKDQVRLRPVDQIDILENGIGRALIPGFIRRTHLRRDRHYELMRQETAELPRVPQVLEQRLALELSEDIRGIDSGVDQIAEYKVDNPVFPAEGDSRLGPVFGQRIKAGSLSAGQHHCKNSTIHGSSPVVVFCTMPQTLADCQLWGMFL